jgi:hypothetical protein
MILLVLVSDLHIIGTKNLFPGQVLPKTNNLQLQFQKSDPVLVQFPNLNWKQWLSLGSPFVKPPFGVTFLQKHFIPKDLVCDFGSTLNRTRNLVLSLVLLFQKIKTWFGFSPLET